MAKEISVSYQPGYTIYATVRNASRQYANSASSAFETRNVANWTDYDVAVLDSDNIGTYEGNFPSWITLAGLYLIEARIRIGATPAISDPIIGEESFPWNGTAEGYVVTVVMTGTGANLVTITVNDTLSSVVAGARVTIKNSAQTAVIATGETNLLGIVTFNLDNGSYKALVTTTPFYESLAVQTLTVSGTTTATFTLTPTTISSPVDPGLCAVYLDIYTGSGVAAAGIIVYATPEFTPLYTSTVLITTQKLSATSDVNGRATLTLIRKDQITSQNKAYRITCEDLGINVAVEVPNQSTVDLRTLI